MVAVTVAADALVSLVGPTSAASRSSDLSTKTVQAGQTSKAFGTELNVLDPPATESAAARKAFGSKPVSNLAIRASLLAGLALLVASLGIGRRSRS
jgi:hypothetical protein